MYYHIHYRQSLSACQLLMVRLEKMTKSKLQEVALKEGDATIVDHSREVVVESRHNSTYIDDLMAALRSMVQIPVNYEELTWKLLSFPKGFQRVNIASIKLQLRLEKEKIVDAVASLSLSRLRPSFQAFLRSGENNNRFINLLCETISSSPDRALVIW